jgi:hypothetical protein
MAGQQEDALRNRQDWRADSESGRSRIGIQQDDSFSENFWESTA